MSSNSASTWSKFFTSAGIPNPTNLTYAHIFVENRIQMDMLSELNKEHLKEMGITPMGDIISILRHSKTVTDESVRSKILKSHVDVPKSIAAIRPASPSVSTTISSVAITPARRVLPEHEGGYKISLPKGNTQKSRELLAKHALQMDKVEKKSIFDRLSKDKDVEMADSTSSDSLVRISRTSKSIRDRLSDWEVRKKVERKSIEFSGILKNSPTKQPPKGVVKHRVNQRVILKKVPSRIAMQTDSDYTDDDDRMDSDDISKQVKFSPEVEVLEIEPRRVPKLNATKISRIKGLRTDGIKDRLGAIKIHRSVDAPSSNLHRVKKTIGMKPTKITSPINKNSKMRADQISVPVKARLDTFKNRRLTASVHSRLNIKGGGGGGGKGSVFNRLGK